MVMGVVKIISNLSLMASRLALPFIKCLSIDLCKTLSHHEIPATYNGTRDDVKSNENKIVGIFRQLVLSSISRAQNNSICIRKPTEALVSSP